MARSYLYFVSDGAGHVKIGLSSHPGRRVSALQTSSPRRLETLLIIPGERADEAHFHESFGPDRVAGEWFRDSKWLREFIDWAWDTMDDGPAAESLSRFVEDDLLEQFGGGSFQYREHERGY